MSDHKTHSAYVPIEIAQAPEHGEAEHTDEAHALTMTGEPTHDSHGAAAPDAHPVDPHAGDAHEESGYIMPHEVPNLATLMEAAFKKDFKVEHGHRPHPHMEFYLGPVPVPINPLFSLLFALVIVWLIRKAFKNPSLRKPGKLQTLMESFLGGLQNFFLGVMGPEGKRFIPYLASLWVFILLNNIGVLFPLMKSPTSSFKTTIALAIVTMLYARYHNIRELGFLGYLHHLAGSPRDAIGWGLAPMFFLLELVGEVIKPVSLALRLYGNIFGEDKLLASMLGLGMALVAVITGTTHPIIGVPFEFPFFFMVVLLSTIQATVFTLLAAIYLQLMMPHEHVEHDHEEQEADFQAREGTPVLP